MNKVSVFVFSLSILLVSCPPACHAAAMGDNGVEPGGSFTGLDGNATDPGGGNAPDPDGNDPGLGGGNASYPDDNDNAAAPIPDLQPFLSQYAADSIRNGEDSGVFRFALVAALSLWASRTVTQRRRS